MSERPERKQIRTSRGDAFREALIQRHARVPQGWQKQLAASTGYSQRRPGILGRILRGSSSGLAERRLDQDDRAAPEAEASEGTRKRRPRDSQASAGSTLAELRYECGELSP